MTTAYVRQRKSDGTWGVAHVLAAPSTRSLETLCGRADITYSERKDFPTDPGRVCRTCARIAGA